jgi:UDP-2,3-diacylglucosamine pyrophosphatase LpxH
MIARVVKEFPLLELLFDRPTIFVSDLHQNVAGPQDNFQAGLFAWYLLSRTVCGRRVVIVGDRRDLWEALAFVPRRGGDRETEVRAAIASRNSYTDMLLACFVVEELNGNHDRLSAGDVWSAECVRWTDQTVVMHGHQLAPACSSAGWLGRAAARAWGIIEHLRLARALGWARDLAQGWYLRRTRTTRGAAGNEAQRDWVRENAGERVLAVFGHTHEAGLDQVGETIWANCGSWVEPGVGWAIEVEGRAVRLVTITA